MDPHRHFLKSTGKMRSAGVEHTQSLNQSKVIMESFLVDVRALSFERILVAIESLQLLQDMQQRNSFLLRKVTVI